MISAVDNNIIWGMSGTTSGAYCQQWTTICGATCIFVAFFLSKTTESEKYEFITENSFVFETNTVMNYFIFSKAQIKGLKFQVVFGEEQHGESPLHYVAICG